MVNQQRGEGIACDVKPGKAAEAHSRARHALLGKLLFDLQCQGNSLAARVGPYLTWSCHATFYDWFHTSQSR
jgi:hypothetical protein